LFEVVELETCFNNCDKDSAFFSSDEQRWINKIRKLLEEHPDEMRLIASPETNDGCIYVELPARWLKIKPPTKRELSEEEKDVLRERLARLRSQT
jgi:hypothetical protein